MNRTFAGVGIVTLATLLLELLLTRIFSVTLYYHFAFMVISLALFGLGLSGVVLYLRPKRFPEEKLAELLASYSRRFAVTAALALVFVVNHPMTAYLDALTPGRFTIQHFFQLAFLFSFAALPFFYGGMVVSLALFHLRRNVATVYFFDLAGASLACLVLDPVLRGLGGPSAVLFVSVLGAAAALLFGSDLKRWRPQRSSMVLAGAVVLLLVVNLSTGWIGLGSFKFVKKELLAFSKWNALSRIEVQEIKLHKFNLVEPSLTIDAMARTTIYSYDHREAFAKQQSLPGGGGGVARISSLTYSLGKDRKVLIIGPGGGIDVLTAMVNGHRDITLAEINPIILHDVMLGKYRKYTGDLYARPGVKPNLAEGRSFVRRSTERYDVIQATLVDTWAASATGTFALSENHLYTVEAFEDYLSHLTDNGLVSMSRWLKVQGMEFVRLCSLARTALERLGVKQPGLHAFAAGEGGVGVLLVKRKPFTKQELDRLHAVSKARNFFIIYSPRGTYVNPASIVLGSQKLQEFYASFPIDVRPVYDDRPFFFYAVKPERLAKALLSGELLGLNSFSAVVLLSLLGLVTVLVICGIVIPLWLGQRGALAGQRASKLRDLAFFVCIGVGFIIVEIGLLQRFTLFLGHPIHSLRVVLFALLLSSAVGSLLSGRARNPRTMMRVLAGAGLGVAALMVLYGYVLGPLFYGGIGWPLSARVVVAGLLVALPGLLMGMMLPTAVRLLSGRHTEIIPWAWGLNGAASVLGSVLSMIVAIHLGFTVTLLAGGAVYVLAVLVALRRSPEAVDS